MTTPINPRDELRALIASRLADGMTADQAADAVFGLFWSVSDEWWDIEETTFGQADRHYQDNRHLKCMIARDVVRRTEPRVVGRPQPKRVPDRRVE